MFNSIKKGLANAATDAFDKSVQIKNISTGAWDKGEISSKDVALLISLGVSVAALASMFGVAEYIIKELGDEESEEIVISLKRGENNGSV